jgi:hypothetical protein
LDLDDLGEPAMTNPLEVVQNLILDTLEPFIVRLEALEQRAAAVTNVMGGEATAAPQRAQKPEAKVGTPEKTSSVSEDRVEAVLALHRLDAVPQQWVFKGGKRESAPDGMWEITCAVCSDHKIDWKEGDPPPPRCKTVNLLTR